MAKELEILALIRPLCSFIIDNQAQACACAVFVPINIFLLKNGRLFIDQVIRFRSKPGLIDQIRKQ